MSKKQYIGIEKRQARWGFIFVVPAILFFSVFSYFPILNALYTSFFDKRVLSLAAPPFVGFGNYVYLFTSSVAGFWNSLRATFVFTLGTFIPLLVFSLVWAVFLTQAVSRKSRGFFPDRLLYPGCAFIGGSRGNLEADVRSQRAGKSVG